MFVGNDSKYEEDNNTGDSGSSDLGSSKTLEGSKEKDDGSDNFTRVFSQYKRQSAGIISEAKQKEVYLKPSVKRKLKSELARKKRNKKNKNNYRFGKQRGV